MLVMGSKTLTVEGVTVFADHADPRQFWYLPAPVALAERDGVPQFTLIRYRPAVANAGVQGGGFLMMEVELRLDPGVEQKILSAVSRFSDGTPRLTPVPFDDGKVQVVALNIQGGGGTNAPVPPPGAFMAVESILGATKPSLAGNNSAVFSLTLSQEGSTILDQAFREGATPIGIIYDLKYTALRPALDVKITANFKRIYDHLSFGVDLTAGAVIYGVPVYLEVGIDMAFEKLKQDGVITIEVINFTNSADEADKEKWALDFFKQNLLQQWFQPTLAPVTFDRKPPTGGTTPAGGAASGGGATSGGGAARGGGASSGGASSGGASSGGASSGGASSGGASSGGASSGGASSGGASSGGASSGGASSGGASSGGASSGGASSGGASSGGASSGGASSGGASSGGASSGGASSGGASSGGASSGGGSPAGHGGGEAPEAAVLPSRRVTREMWAYPFLETARQPARLDRTVDPETPGYDIQMTQSGENDQVTLMFLGGTEAPAVRIDGVQQDLSEARQLTLSIAGGAAPRNIEAQYPAAAAEAEEFRLYFDFDKPRAPGWSIAPPSSAYSGYLSNRTNPLDSRYQISTGPAGAPGGTPSGADALRAWLRSSIGSPRRVTVEANASFEGDDSTASLNQQLTQRRADVAVGIIGSDAEVTAVNPLGFTVARTAGRIGNPDDRYALIRGVSAGGRPVTIRGTVSRDATTNGSGSGGGTGGGTGTATTGTGTGGTGSGTGTGGTGTGGGTGSTGGTTGGTGTGGTGTGGRPGTGTGGTGTGASGGTGGTTGTGGAAGAGGAGGGAAKPPIPQTPPMGVKLAFRLQKIEQIEDKTLTFRYTRQSAEQRSYAPQGLIGLLADDLEGPPHFIEVDLDSPFFRQLDIEVEAPAVFDPIGLMKADVAIEYGRATDPVGIKHKDISFRPTGSHLEKASFFLNPKRDLNYALGLQYHFSPLAGWDGEKLSYELPSVASLDRTLLVNPFRDFGFFEIKVVPGDIDRDMVDSTDVQLHYEHPGRWSRDKVITVRPDSPMQSWKLRLSDPLQQTFTYKWTHRLKDGTTRETEPVSTNIPLITVSDPYEEPLILEVYPNYDTASIRLLIVDITYEDPGATRPRVQQIKFQPADTQSKRVRFARTDPSVGGYSIQLTILGNDNSVRRLRPVRLTDSIVFLGEYMGLETLSRR